MVTVDLIFKNSNILHFLEINFNIPSFFFFSFFEALTSVQHSIPQDHFLKPLSEANTFSFLISLVLHKHSSGLSFRVCLFLG